MHLDDDGELIIDQPEVDGPDVETARAAARICPVAALKLV